MTGTEGHTKRNLQARHLEMIAIGGTIGTGLFLGAGNALSGAGPAGTLVAYNIVGVFVYFVVCALGEMAAFIPVSGSFNEYSARFVDPSLGFSMGWNYWFSWAVTLPIEMSAAAIAMTYWFPDTPTWVWSAIVLVVASVLNVFSVKAFGEAEFWFSLIKVIAVVLFILVGIVVVIKDRVWFRNWSVGGGAFGNHGVEGTFGSFMTAFFSYGGTELVGIAAGEAANPSVTIPKAIKNTFYRILIFYSGAIFIIGLLLPYNDERLRPEADAKSSPFTLALQAAGIPGADHIINVVVIVALMSAANSSMYSSSRTLMALAAEGKAPRFFSKTTTGGVPFYALIPTFVLGMIVIFMSQFGAGKVFDFLVSITGFTILVSWTVICLVHLRFRKAFKYQGYSLEDLKYTAPLFPYGNLVSIIGAIMVVVGTGVTIALSENCNKPIVWIKNLGGIIMFPILYFGHKLVYKTKWVPLGDCDFVTGNADGTIFKMAGEKKSDFKY